MFVAVFQSERIKAIIGPFNSREEADEYCRALGGGSWTISQLQRPE